MVQHINPVLKVQGAFPENPGLGLIVTVNHYSRPGLGAWWTALAVAATCPWEMHWTTTSAWVYDDPLRSMLVTPISRWLLARLARIYDFTSMPPMPPRADEVGQRASAVRRLLRYVDNHPSPVLGLAPEGADAYEGSLMPPPPGIGRLLAQLLKRGFEILPTGVYESEAGLELAIGTAIKPDIPEDRQQQEFELTELTMRAIAALLPLSLRGAYA